MGLEREGEASYVRETLAAAEVLALVRLLTGVSADVNSQSAALDEALVTAGDGAGVGALVAVDSVVALKIRLAIEALLRKILLEVGEVKGSGRR